MAGFDLERFMRGKMGGHAGLLGIGYQDQGDGWVELALPYDAAQIGDPSRGIIASGPILTLMDMATSMSVWVKRGVFSPQATLDLRVDYLRPATPDRTVIGRGECIRVTRSIAFVRGQAHDGDPADPLAHVAGTFMVLDA
ncbi:PaaI family thioesterase [Sphingomonas bacterium]|uniref:PaaI family thioesterase n=1 Tax=Sphingomonas bacterium TaxID=1895847 RepID=UPI0020C5C7E4|nr:PaaI family thioesterase [Sphingomonas bacterium]